MIDRVEGYNKSNRRTILTHLHLSTFFYYYKFQIKRFSASEVRGSDLVIQLWFVFMYRVGNQYEFKIVSSKIRRSYTPLRFTHGRPPPTDWCCGSVHHTIRRNHTAQEIFLTNEFFSICTLLDFREWQLSPSLLNYCHYYWYCNCYYYNLSSSQ
jgi:hypothetical protein